MESNKSPETIESLSKRITNTDAKLAVVVDSLTVIMNLFEQISNEQQRLYYDVEYDMSTLTNNVAYLEDVGNGEVY